MSDRTPEQMLNDLRVDIDRIDATMHALLMERGQIIDTLISVKGKQGGGSAFRPVRETSMMRNLLRRHSGILPLDTIEGIWRIIIATFTYVQAKFAVHADISGGDAAIRDSVRFHFGFTVPYLTHAGASAVIDAVANSVGDLGVLRLDGGLETGAWWSKLKGETTPKVIARYPVVSRPNHPASLPVFVISKPVAEAASREIVVRCIQIDRWTERVRDAITQLQGELLGATAEGVGLSLMVSMPGEVSEAAVREAFNSAGVIDVRVYEIGSHAAIHEISPPVHRA